MVTLSAISLTPSNGLSFQSNKAIEKKAEEFEALVLSLTLKPMFESAKSSALFGGDGPEQDAFRSMLNDEYAKAIAARGGVGIADQVKDALIRLQSGSVIS